jgi:hypothetical protein
MDPNAALAIMNDKSLDMAERRESAYCLRTWIKRGGFAPSDMSREEAVQQANRIILGH